MKPFEGTQALLDRTARILEESGRPEALGRLAAMVLRTESEEVASRVFEPLLRRDPRFAVRRNRVSLRVRPDPYGDVPAEQVPLAVLDFETSGSPPGDRAIEIGIACFEGGEEMESFSTLLNPGVPVAAFVTRLTGIRPEDLRGQPTFEETWPQVEPLLEGRVLVAHNLPFDHRVLRGELSRIGVFRRPSETFCTLRFARKIFARSQPGGLDALAHRFGLEFAARHRALDDARVAGRVFYRLLRHLREEEDLSTWGDLRRFVNLPRRGPSRAR